MGQKRTAGICQTTIPGNLTPIGAGDIMRHLESRMGLLYEKIGMPVLFLKATWFCQRLPGSVLLGAEIFEV